jgi:hypothetical protein
VSNVFIAEDCLIVSFVLSLSTAFLATVNMILVEMCTWRMRRYT